MALECLINLITEGPSTRFFYDLNSVFASCSYPSLYESHLMYLTFHPPMKRMRKSQALAASSGSHASYRLNLGDLFSSLNELSQGVNAIE